MENLKDLPLCMAERAIWARKEFIKNPTKSQIDDDFLVWCFNEEDKKWYSIGGNYSWSSPQEKRQKEYEREQHYFELSEKFEEERIRQESELIYWSDIRKKILKRDKNICQICGKTGKTKLHIHHILKRKNGGEDFFDNLITVCPSCHPVADKTLYNPEWK